MHCRNHSFYWSRWMDEKHESNVKALPNHFVYLSFHTLFIKAFIAHEANARSWFCYSNDECNILHLLQRNICCLPSDDLKQIISLACLYGNVFVCRNSMQTGSQFFWISVHSFLILQVNTLCQYFHNVLLQFFGLLKKSYF